MQLNSIKAKKIICESTYAKASVDRSVALNSSPNMTPENTLENFFATFRANVIGRHQSFESPFGRKKIVYADWTASGRAYQPIEECLQREVMPFVANVQCANGSVVVDRVHRTETFDPSSQID